MKYIILSIILFFAVQNLFSQNEIKNYNVYLLWEMVYNLHEVMMGEPDSIIVATDGALLNCVWTKAGESNINWISSIELGLVYLDQPAIVSIKWIEPKYQSSNKEEVFTANNIDPEDFDQPIIEYSEETGELLEVYKHKKVSGMVFSLTKFKGKYKAYSILYFPLLYNIDEYPPELKLKIS